MLLRAYVFISPYLALSTLVISLHRNVHFSSLKAD